MAKMTVNQDTCKGCGLCVQVCPKKIISLDKRALNQKVSSCLRRGPEQMRSDVRCALRCVRTARLRLRIKAPPGARAPGRTVCKGQ